MGFLMPGYPFKAFMDFGSVVLSDGNADLCSSIICVTDSWLTIHIENKLSNTASDICCDFDQLYIEFLEADAAPCI